MPAKPGLVDLPDRAGLTGLADPAVLAGLAGTGFIDKLYPLEKLPLGEIIISTLTVILLLNA
jgi:hypothetical protein